MLIFFMTGHQPMKDIFTVGFKIGTFTGTQGPLTVSEAGSEEVSLSTTHRNEEWK